MPAPAVHIDRIDLDLRGVPASVAQAALASLGPALQQALAAQASTGSDQHSSPHAESRLDGIDAGHVQLPPGASAADLRGAIAQRLARAVARQIGPAPTL